MLVVGGSTSDDTIRIRTEGDHDDDDAEYITIRINEHDEVRQQDSPGTSLYPSIASWSTPRPETTTSRWEDVTAIPGWLYGGDGNDHLAR